MPKSPAVFELWERKTVSRRSVFGEQNCLYFNLPQSSSNKRYKRPFSKTKRLNCFRYFRYDIGKPGDLSGLPRCFHENTSRISSLFCFSWTKSRGCVRFGKPFKKSSKSSVSLKFTCGIAEWEKKPFI